MLDHTRPVIVVVGSLHYDIMVDAPDRPRKGETVTGYRWRPKFGGKGGNQAIAAAKAGALVRMVGAVGDDDFGSFLMNALREGGVEASCVAVIPRHASGMSVAISDDSGDYGAVIVSGSNASIDLASLAREELWQDAKVLILQNEMPETVNVAAARAARNAGVAVCVNAAPFRPLSPEFEGLIDILVVNAIEAEQLNGVVVDSLAAAKSAANALAERFPTVVVTAGGDGVAGVMRGNASVGLPAIPVELVSTHGAGDVFVGSLAHAIALGSDFETALGAANSAAAEHVSAPKS